MFTLMQLPYSYNDLEPYIDSKTVEIHYSKHHQTYVNKLNEILTDHSELAKMDLVFLLKNLDQVPEDIRSQVFNNAGQVYNHNLYWETMGPNSGGEPTGKLAEKINSTFGSFEKFKESFNKLGATQFGSGWVWLSLDDGLNLVIDKTSNADTPIVYNKTPIMTMDVWEHAYYLNYQNRRPDYINAFWNVVNWNIVSAKYENALVQV